MENMDKNRIRKIQLKAVGIPVGVALLLSALAVFPVLNFHGTRIPLFALDRITRFDLFRGKVLGDRVLKTEYGEIRLQHLSEVYSMNNTLWNIDFIEFEEGRASHNLVVHGIEIPPNVSITFDDFDRVSIILMHGLTYNVTQEITVSGKRLHVSQFFLNHSEDLPDIGITIDGTPEYITLADDAVLDLSELWGAGLSIFKNDERWILGTNFGYVLLKLPGKAEFARYREITFKPDWGEFIEGELWEDRKRSNRKN